MFDLFSMCEKLVKIMVLVRNISHDINSFVTEVPIIQKPVHWFALQINGLVFIWLGPPSRNDKDSFT